MKEIVSLNWLSKLERKWGRYAIHNLTMYLIGAYIVGYGISFLTPGLMRLLYLRPGAILNGEIWRLVSWVLVPPGGNIITIVIMLLLYYSLGTSLERTWGAFRYNVYIFSGILFTVLGAFVLYLLYGNQVDIMGAAFSTYYINLSIFLAFAVSYPDMELMLYFILPIKMKWMGAVYGAYILYQLAIGSVFTKVVIISSLLNFIVFFFFSRNIKPYMPKEQARKTKFKKQVRTHMTYANGAKHRCAVCGRTELDHPELEFRFCSKCNGNYEYCQDHLFTHQHVK